MAKHFKLSPLEIDTAYGMCGFQCLNPEFTADIFNALFEKGKEFALSDAVPIKMKFQNQRKNSFQSNSVWFRKFYTYRRNKK